MSLLILNLDADRTKKTLLLIFCFDLWEAHIGRAKFFDGDVPNHCDVDKNGSKYHWYRVIIHCKQSVNKRESKLCYFLKIRSNTNNSKTWHSQEVTRTGASLKLR